MNEETERYLPYDSIQYLDKKKHVEIWGSKLPHWFLYCIRLLLCQIMCMFCSHLLEHSLCWIL